MPLESSAESQPDIALADAYLRGQALTSADVLSLAKRLKKKDKFGLARRVLARVRKQGGFDASLGRKLAQEHALCTYKDPDRPVLQALDEGLDILRGSFDLDTTEDQETLGLSGAIYKRRWQATGSEGSTGAFVSLLPPRLRPRAEKRLRLHHDKRRVRA